MNKEKYYTYKLNLNILNILAIIIYIPLSIIIFILERNDNYVITSNIIELFLLMFIWLIIHELLHGLGFALFKEVDKKNITFGMALEKGVFYCMCKQTIEKRTILTSLLMPLTTIGIITLIIGMSINNYILVLLSVVNIVGSIGDIVMTIYFLKVGEVKYLDLDDCTSFTVLSKKDISNTKVLGIELIDTGIYNKNKMYSRNKKRLNISKFSYLLLITIGIIIIINIVGGI